MPNLEEHEGVMLFTVSEINLLIIVSHSICTNNPKLTYFTACTNSGTYLPGGTHTRLDGVAFVYPNQTELN